MMRSAEAGCQVMRIAQALGLESAYPAQGSSATLYQAAFTAYWPPWFWQVIWKHSPQP